MTDETKFRDVTGRWLAGQPLVKAICVYGTRAFNETRAQFPDWIPDLAGTTCHVYWNGIDLHSALLTDADLRLAHLCDADLSGAVMRGTNMHKARISGADLSDARLSGASLQAVTAVEVNFSNANLCGCDLRFARLNRANLDGTLVTWATGNGREVCSLEASRHHVAWVPSTRTMAIGCKQYAMDEWWDFDDETIAEMDDEALIWWKEWRPVLMTLVERRQ